jgi:ATP/maltotriose-dependent transcriptional regulator MalT
MPAGFVGGASRLAAGDAEAAARQLAASLEAYEAQGCRQFAPYFLAAWGEAEVATGRTEVALGVLDRASRLAASTGQHFADAEIERVRAAAEIGQGDANAAAGRLRAAREIAHAQGARLLELRASVSLARLLAGRGEGRQARDFLRSVYASLAGGLDTPDLQDAATLLGQLN